MLIQNTLYLTGENPPLTSPALFSLRREGVCEVSAAQGEKEASSQSIQAREEKKKTGIILKPMKRGNKWTNPRSATTGVKPSNSRKQRRKCELCSGLVKSLYL